MDFEAQLLLVIKVEVSVAAIFLERGMVDRAGFAFVLGLLVDQRARELLSVIALVFVEPSAAIGHFQVGFTEEVAVFREVMVEPLVPTRVQGNIRCGGLSWIQGRLFGIDILIDFKGIVGGIRDKCFQAVGPLFHQRLEGRQSRFDICGVGGEDLFIEKGRAIGCGFHECSLFCPPEVADFGFSVFMFFSGDRFCSQRAFRESFDGASLLKTLVDALFEVIFFDPGENLGGVGDGRSFQQILGVQLVKGLLEQQFEVLIVYDLQLSS